MSWIPEMKKGDKVFWHDPEDGFSSGIYILQEDDEAEYPDYDDIFLIRSESGLSEAEVYRGEIVHLKDYSIVVETVEDELNQYRFYILEKGKAIDGNDGFDSEEKAYEDAVGALGYILR
jgi:hypothetical protein